MNTALLVVSLTLLGPNAPAADSLDERAIEQAMNQGVELEAPDCQAISAVKILSGGKTRAGDMLYVCEADLVWTIGVGEFKEKVVEAAKRQGNNGAYLAAVAPQAIAQQLPAFKKGDLVTKVRIRVRLERAGDDWIAVAAKVYRFDPSFTLHD